MINYVSDDEMRLFLFKLTGELSTRDMNYTEFVHFLLTQDLVNCVGHQVRECNDYYESMNYVYTLRHGMRIIKLNEGKFALIDICYRAGDTFLDTGLEQLYGLAEILRFEQN